MDSDAQAAKSSLAAAGLKIKFCLHAQLYSDHGGLLGSNTPDFQKGHPVSGLCDKMLSSAEFILKNM